MNQTKKYTMIGICLCLMVIIGVGGYNSFHQEKKQPQVNTSVVEKQHDVEESVNKNNEIENKVKEKITESEKQKADTSKKQETNENKTVTNKKQTPNNQTKQEEFKEETSIKNEIPVEEVKKEFIQIKIEGIQTTIVNQSVQIDSESTAFSVLKSVCQQNNIKLSTSGYGSFAYVTGIGDLKEKEHGSMSGWKYKVNGVEPNIGAGHYKLKHNDQVIWYYQYS